MIKSQKKIERNMWDYVYFKSYLETCAAMSENVLDRIKS